MAANMGEERRDASHHQFSDQNFINQVQMRGVHYHQPRLATRIEVDRDIPHSLPGPHFLVPFSENKQFVGREDIIKRLEDGLFSNDCLHSMAIVGLGGVGKTQVALQIAYLARTRPGWSVFWLSALSMAAFEQTCTDMVGRVRISTPGTEDAKQLVKRYLESSASGRWVLIVDNADDVVTVMGPGGIYTYLPKNGNGCILFSTRTMDVAQAVADDEAEKLAGMIEDDAKAFLQKLLPESQADDEMVTELLRTLTFLPLAISQAAAYMKRNKTPVSRYLSLFREVKNEAIGLLSREFPDHTRYPESRHVVASTWLVSFEQIRKIDETATKLLSFLSQIEPRAIPLSILPPTPPNENLEDAVTTLCRYSFLCRREDGKILDMHKPVHLAAQEWLDRSGDVNHAKREAVAHLATVFQSDCWEDREMWRKYMPHVLKVIRINDKGGRWEEGECKLGYWVGRCLQVEGRIIDAVVMLEHVVQARQVTLAENHPDRLASQHALARAYQANGQVKEAVIMLEHVVQAREATLPEDHPDRLASQHALARAYQANGQVKEAVLILEHVVQVREVTLAEDHPDRLASQHALAIAYRACGKIEEAVEILHHVVKVKRRTLSRNHPSRIASQHALAWVYQANGQVEKAAAILEEVVNLREATLKVNHPDLLESQHALAWVYQANGQVKLAIELLEHVVKVREATLAEDHPDRLASQYALARAYQANGQVKEAVLILEHVVQVREVTLAENHPDRLASQHALARAYQANGQAKEAVMMLEHVVKVREVTLAENHSSRLVSQYELAGIYQANGQLKEAVVMLEHVVKVQKMILAENHPSRLASQYELAGVFIASGQVEEAVELLQHVVKVQETTLAENHPSRLASQHALARAYYANGQFKEAVELLKHVVKVMEATLAEDHPDRLASQYSLAGAYQANGQVKEAVVMLEHVVQARQVTLAETHPHRLASQYALARAHRFNSQFDKSAIWSDWVTKTEGAILAKANRPSSPRVDSSTSVSDYTSAESSEHSTRPTSIGSHVWQQRQNIAELLAISLAADADLKLLYVRACRKFGASKFVRKHEQLLKSLYNDLKYQDNSERAQAIGPLGSAHIRKEVSCQIFSTFARSQERHNSAFSDLQVKVAEEVNIPEWLYASSNLHDHHQDSRDHDQDDGVSDDDESNSSGSDDEALLETTAPVKSQVTATMVLVTPSTAFGIYKQNLSDLSLAKEESRPSAVVTSQHNIEAIAERLQWRDTDGEDLSDEYTSLLPINLRKPSFLSQARHWVQNRVSPPLRGFNRISFVCGCGELTFVDVEEISEGGLQQFHQELSRACAESSQASSNPDRPSKCSPQPKPLQKITIDDGFAGNIDDAESCGANNSITNDVAPQSQVTTASSDEQYLVLCIATRRRDRLGHVTIDPHMNDEQMFRHIREEVAQTRRNHEWGPLTAVPDLLGKVINKLPAKFTIRIPRQVASLFHWEKWPNLEVIEAGEPVSFQLLPALPENLPEYATYGWPPKNTIPQQYRCQFDKVRIRTIPGHIFTPGRHSSSFFLKRLAKKQHQRLCRTGGSDESVIGYGLRIRMRISRRYVTLLVLIAIGVIGSVVLIYAMTTGDASSALALGAFLAAIAVVLPTYLMLNHQAG